MNPIKLTEADAYADADTNTDADTIICTSLPQQHKCWLILYQGDDALIIIMMAHSQHHHHHDSQSGSESASSHQNALATISIRAWLSNTWCSINRSETDAD